MAGRRERWAGAAGRHLGLVGWRRRGRRPPPLGCSPSRQSPPLQQLPRPALTCVCLDEQQRQQRVCGSRKGRRRGRGELRRAAHRCAGHTAARAPAAGSPVPGRRCPPLSRTDDDHDAPCCGPYSPVVQAEPLNVPRNVACPGQGHRRGHSPALSMHARPGPCPKQLQQRCQPAAAPSAPAAASAPTFAFQESWRPAPACGGKMQQGERGGVGGCERRRRAAHARERSRQRTLSASVSSVQMTRGKDSAVSTMASHVDQA